MELKKNPEKDQKSEVSFSKKQYVLAGQRGHKPLHTLDKNDHPFLHKLAFFLALFGWVTRNSGMGVGVGG